MYRTQNHIEWKESIILEKKANSNLQVLLICCEDTLNQQRKGFSPNGKLDHYLLHSNVTPTIEAVSTCLAR
jgi:hypothetical protein